jgi:uncharacterized protein (DUF1501 family)
MTLNRRDFVRTTLAGSGVVALGPWSFSSTSDTSVPTFLSQAGAAAPALGAKGSKDTILVVVELTGGNDGLNTVVPFADPEYAKLRPTLAIPKAQLKKVNDSLGLHPSLTGFAELLEAGNLCIVQGVGYPNPDQSHFRSMDIWQAGSMAETLTEGWLGKALKKMPAGTQSFHLKTENQSSPLAFNGAPMRVPSIGALSEFTLKTTASSATDKSDQAKVIEEAAKSTKKPGLLDFVSRTASNTYDSSKRLQHIASNYQPKATYPETTLASRLRLAAQLIDADIGARIFYVSIDGFDTHATQAPAHADLLTQVSGAMTAFFKDIKARGNGDRVLMMTFSEFGRRVRENGSRGTDHGSGSQMFLIGNKVKSGVIGDHPSLTKVPMGNLGFHTDFRQVYANICEKWLGVASKDVLGESFKPVEVFKG